MGKQKAHLFLQRAHQNQVEYFQEDEEGTHNFTWASFNQSEIEQVKLKANSALSAKAWATFYYQKEVPQSLTKRQYLTLLEKTISAIKEKQWGKVVISRAQFFSQKVEPQQLFEQLCAAYPQLTVYLFSHPKSGTWCGATPETLLALDGETLRTMSLAGTMPLGQEADFSSKEYHEQQLVTNFIEKTLKSSGGIGKVNVAPVGISQAGQVAHLQTLIEAQIKPHFNLNKLLENLHPTPAVSGLPRQTALNYIAKNEKYQRSFYSGYFGISHQQHAHYWVNLRCMQIFENGFTLYAGGGITAQSVAQSEWEETQAKMETLLGVVNP